MIRYNRQDIETGDELYEAERNFSQVSGASFSAVEYLFSGDVDLREEVLYWLRKTLKFDER